VGLAKNLAQAQSIRASNARSFDAAGQYSPVLGDLTNAELSYLGNPSGSLVSDSSFSTIDNVNPTLTVTGAGAGYWAYQAGRVPTQTTIPGPYGMTGYSNVVGRANVIGGASLGLGIAGVTVGSIATVNSFATDDTAGGISNLAGTALSGLALVPGPIGIAAGTGSAVVNGTIALLQAGVDARAHVNLVARARDAINTMQLADQRIGAIRADITAKGCL
jgi:hypothetical protein